MRAFTITACTEHPMKIWLKSGIKIYRKHEPIKGLKAIRYYFYKPVGEGLRFYETKFMEDAYNKAGNKYIFRCNLLKKNSRYFICNQEQATEKNGVILKLVIPQAMAEKLKNNKDFTILSETGTFFKEIISLYYGKMRELPSILCKT
jgi:hypothetical protein